MKKWLNRLFAPPPQTPPPPQPPVEITEPWRIFEAFLMHYYTMTPERWQRALDRLEKVHTLINNLIRAMTDNPEEPPYDELDPLDPRNRWIWVNNNWVWPDLLSLRKTIAALKYQGRFERPMVGNDLGRGFADRLMYYGKPSTVALSGGVTEEAIKALFSEHLSYTGAPLHVMQHTVYPGEMLDYIDLQSRIFDVVHAEEYGQPPLFPGIPLPEELPRYYLRPDLQLKTGQTCPRTGVWRAAEDFAAADFYVEGWEFLNRKAYADHKIYVMKQSEWGFPNYPNNSYVPPPRERPFQPTTWTFVEQVLPEDCPQGGWRTKDLLPQPLATAAQASPARTPAGQPCPRTGFWFTPAAPSSRQRFEQGQIMPDLHNPAFDTIWQWDKRQG